MPSWLTDTAVVTTIITACSGFLTLIVTKIFDQKAKEKKDVLDEILENIGILSEKITTIDETTVSITEQNSVIQDGTKKIIRYRLFHDFKKEIIQGYTTLDHYRELSLLFESYQKLGGNGEVEALYHKYKELTIKEEEKEND